jgi:hypothetical protein
MSTDTFIVPRDEPAIAAADLSDEELAAASAGGTLPSGIKPFQLWPPSRFLAFKADPSACLLGAGYLQRGEWTSLIGIGGLGKTRVSLWLLICQMTRRDWCGLPTNGTPQKAVIFSTETGIKRWQDDLTRFLTLLSDAERALVEANLLILAMTDEEEGDLCLGSPEVIARLKATLREAQPGLLVFDPFVDMVEGDENKTVDIISTLRALRHVTRSVCPSAAVLIIHHARTGAANVAQAGDNFNAGNFARGAKALYSRVRCEIQLAPADRDDPHRLVVACGKANNAPKFAPRCVVLDPEKFTYTVDPDFDFDAWRKDVAGKRKQSSVSITDVVGVVGEFAPVAGDEVSTAKVHEELKPTGASLRSVQRTLNKALEDHYLRAGKKRGLWRLGSKPLPR